ncbi:MAG TPA: TOBE domain-containing protein, partial [Rhodoferax sp.]|nr:TOBE domain-containing protein [Rhodoferax sp.]
CVMVTHDQEEAMTMAGRIAVMSKGRVLQVGSPQEVYEYPGSRFVADFIGSVNLLDGKLSVDETDHCAALTAIGEVHVGHSISGTLGMPVAVAVRPEKVSIGKKAPQGLSHNLFNGRVKEIAYFGSYNTYIVVTPQGYRMKITEPNGSHLDLLDITWEDDVFFWWDDTDALVLRD